MMMSSGLGWAWNFIFMLLVLIHLSDLGIGQVDLNPYICTSTGNYTANSTYRTNLNAALAALSANTTRYGFYTASSGQGADTAYAVALCRADILPDPCRRCVQNAGIELRQVCPNQKQAIRWYEFCMLHYSNQPITGLPANDYERGLINTREVTDPALFRQGRTALLTALSSQAANGSSSIKVGAGVWNASAPEPIYALLQCIPTLSSTECNNCLNQAIQGLDNSAKGARQLRGSCNLRYELYAIYNDSRLTELNAPPLQLPKSPPGPSDGNPSKKKNDNTAKVVIIVVVTFVVCLALAGCGLFYLRKRMYNRVPENPETTEDISTVESLQYDFRRISAATNNFADDKKLGQGGFGAVYRGKLWNGQEIAVKRLSRDSGQGDKEFENEVLLVAKLQHRNLVRLLGFSLTGTERLLIYEYVPNASLDQFIFDPTRSSQLNWDQRYKIIGGTARGLLYLHEDSRLRVIHRDLKASNILLDKDMNPKIADFGMARLFGHDETQGNTSKVVGTYGYMSPEYAIYGQFSVKSDVFSFGVLVMEILSGQRNITGQGDNIEDILSFVWKNWCNGTPENILDPMLRVGRGFTHDMLRCIHIALLCVQENPEDRPTVNSVMVMLSSSTVTLPVPLEPAFVMMSRFNGAGIREFASKETSSSNESKIKTHSSEASSQNEMSVTELYPR